MKSQWEVNEIEELKVFTFGFCNNWIDEKDDVLWSCSEDFQSIGFESKKIDLEVVSVKNYFLQDLLKISSMFGMVFLFLNTIMKTEYRSLL
ncbi:hypothetical protein BV913_10500 [Neisseria dumasiana]|uniref:Uncharacterized protein n=1 Tax=Neisseria dumasiana TaxID=1931275 RepID=A0ABX3WIX0_9NEIS|nr:hypothetical protein BV913_10500 [Neisseria dumasiana]